ncbi:MAG: hypothetical protein ACRC1I_28245 [Pseudomonas proteolytica]|uniref:hypothetical protein n=1 Tax=Pseudomonas proteolytica TaxID=219574 RepID=UPI003F3239AC
MSPRLNRNRRQHHHRAFSLFSNIRAPSRFKIFKRGGWKKNAKRRRTVDKLPLWQPTIDIFFLSIVKRSQHGLVLRPLQEWLSERLTGLVEKGIYQRKLGTPIQKCGFAEYAESVSKRLQPRSESYLTIICGCGTPPKD